MQSVSPVPLFPLSSSDTPPDDAPTATVAHLYAHVPFCPSICPYCDFHVLTRKSGAVEAYLAELQRDAAQLAQQYPTQLKTVYLGGGTPSFLRDAEMVTLSEHIQNAFGWGTQENTLEINPGTVTPQRAKLWRELGFDRASVGVQSLHDPTLQFLGRRHNAKQARQAIYTLLDAGFQVSGDLITAIENQPLEQDIRELAALGVDHISAYTLTIEEGTEFARRGITINEEHERLGFERTAALLGELGFERYEISNYARANRQSQHQSQHNLAYWHGRFYHGVGPSAAGHYPPPPPPHHTSPITSPVTNPIISQRRTNPPLHHWQQGQRGDTEDITPFDYITDALFMGLRLKSGVSLAHLSAQSGLDVAELYSSVINHQQELGLLIQHDDCLKATAQGWWVLNKVLLAFLEFSEHLQKQTGAKSK